MNVIVNHITIEEVDNEEPLIEEGVENTPLIFEEGNKVAVDDLIKVNLRALEDARSVFLSANLMLEEI